MRHAGRRDQRQHAVEEADPGAEDRRQDQLLALDLLPLHRLERRLDRHRFQRQIPGHLVGEEHPDLVEDLPETLGRALLVPQIGELVLHQRVIDHGDPTRRHAQHLSSRLRTNAGAGAGAQLVLSDSAGRRGRRGRAIRGRRSGRPGITPASPDGCSRADRRAEARHSHQSSFLKNAFIPMRKI